MLYSYKASTLLQLKIFLMTLKIDVMGAYPNSFKGDITLENLSFYFSNNQ